jgi:hypothetical protein
MKKILNSVLYDRGYSNEFQRAGVRVRKIDLLGVTLTKDAGRDLDTPIST